VLQAPKTDQLSSRQREAFRQKVLVYRRDPILFFREVLGKTTHWESQVEIARTVAGNKRTTVRSGHDVGKSFVAADVALWFLYCWSPSIVLTTAPTWRQVEKVLWGEIKSHWAAARIPLGGKPLETEIKLGPKWYAAGFSSDKADAWQGFHEKNILVIVDEPSGVDDSVFEQIESILANENARVLLIGNPVRNTGYFAESHRSKTYRKVHISCLDSPNVRAGKVLYPSLVTKEWCDERKEEWGEDSPMYQARVLGNFPTETNDTLIKLAWIQDSYLRHEKNNSPGYAGHVGSVTISCDVARFGDCFTVIIVRKGRRVLDVISYRGYDTVYTKNKLHELIEEYNPEHVIIDDNGVGGGVTDQLRELGHEDIVVPIVAGEQAQDPLRFFNRKAEMGWRVREAFRKGELDIPNHEKLVFECSNQYYDHTKDGSKMRVMSKSMLRKKGLDSPDFFEALSLQYALEIPEGVARTAMAHHGIFSDEVHVREISPENLKIGVSRFQVLVPTANGATALLWACADRKGLVYVYDEELLYRASSSAVAQATYEHESRFWTADERYVRKVFLSDEVQKNRYLLTEQLEDHELFYDEIEYTTELATMSLREGLMYDRAQPLNNQNHPFVYFHPRVKRTIDAVKYSSNPKVLENDPVHAAFHEALGLLILTEPVWVKAYS
jgi:hypothetical protein